MAGLAALQHSCYGTGVPGISGVPPAAFGEPPGSAAASCCCCLQGGALLHALHARTDAPLLPPPLLLPLLLPLPPGKACLTFPAAACASSVSTGGRRRCTHVRSHHVCPPVPCTHTHAHACTHRHARFLFPAAAHEGLCSPL